MKRPAELQARTWGKRGQWIASLRISRKASKRKASAEETWVHQQCGGASRAFPESGQAFHRILCEFFVSRGRVVRVASEGMPREKTVGITGLGVLFMP
jgi:hypothetical protein